MSKVAILVIGAKAPKILGRVLDFFDDQRFRFFLHLDAKIDCKSYLSELGRADRVTFVEPRVRVFWGGFSMIEAEISLIRAALLDSSISNLVLWSDDTVPLRSPDVIYRSIMDSPDRIACEFRPYTQEWYTGFYFGDSNFTSFIKHLEGRDFGALDWENMQRLQRFKERGKKTLEKVYFSRQWWALSRNSVSEILRYLHEDEHLLESFRYSMFADETLFATLFQLCFPGKIVPDVPMFADYDRPPVPYIYTQPHELPELKKLSENCLFIRKIWPWSTRLVDQIARGWLAQDTTEKGTTSSSSALIGKDTIAGPSKISSMPNDDDYKRALAIAVEAREDGRLEESATLFERFLSDHPGNPDITLGYFETLVKLRRYDNCDLLLAAAIIRHPDHFQLRRHWAELPGRYLDHEEVIRRNSIFWEVFPPAKYPAAWTSLAMVYGSLSESLRWDELSSSIGKLMKEAIQNPEVFRINLWQATELCLTDKLKKLVGEGRQETWNQMPQEAKGNVRLRIEMAELNQRLMEMSTVRIIPIGQNCLPYLLGGRWGLIAQRERPEATTPFDRGAFQKNNAAVVIDNDFATFDDRREFAEAGVYDGSKMYRHEATGIYFYHERGPFWMSNDGERFFPRLEQMIATWRKISLSGQRLFVFCLCGEGELDKLVAAMDQRLLGSDAHLLIVDVLQQPHHCPEHEHVTYVHIPYPPDYTWDDFRHQSAARGVGFELTVVNAIVNRLIPFVSGSEASLFNENRSRLLRYYAGAAASWRHDHDNSVFLYAALQQVNSDDPQDALAYGRALHGNGKIAEAQKVLARQKELHPGVYDVHAAWVYSGVAPFDWDEKLARLRSLREAFPPEVEPRSWGTLSEELKTLTEHGSWDEAALLIKSQWPIFTTKTDPFRGALATLIQLGDLVVLRRLLEEATPSARESLVPETINCISERMAKAEANRALVRRYDVKIISLGQTGLATVLTTRWGLKPAPRSFDDSTPFELGDFYGDTTADAITDDFAALSNRENYIEKPAWGGGVTLRHIPSDVAFLIHRYARMSTSEKQRFFSHLDQMVAYWRQIKDTGFRIFIYFCNDRCDLDRLVAAAKDKLLGKNAKLVIVDLNEESAKLAYDPNVILLHAPMPAGYPWFNALGSATPEGINYEERVLAPVIDFLKSCAADADHLMELPV